MKKLLIALVLCLLPTLAFAQCNGIFPNNTVCGNSTGSNDTARPTPFTSFPSASINAAGPSTGTVVTNATNGYLLYNNNGFLQSINPSSIPVPGSAANCLSDDTTVLQTAINATPTNGTLDLGGGCYLIGTSSAGTEVLLFNHPIHFTNGTLTLAASGIGATTDIFRLKPLALSDSLGWRFDLLMIKTNASGYAGRHLFNADTTTSAAAIISNPVFDQISEVWNFAAGLTNGDFFHITQFAGTSLNTQRPVFSNIWAAQCINLDFASDAALIHHVAIIAPTPGSKSCGFKVGLVSGSINVTVDGGNIFTANGGNIIGDTNGGVFNTIIRDSAFEQNYTSYEQNGAMLDFGTGGVQVFSSQVENISIDSIITKSTIQLSSVSGIAVGQTVTGSNIPGACTVAQVSVSPETWIYLSCLQTGPVSNGATIVVNGVNFTAVGTSGAQAVGFNYDFATNPIIDASRFGSGLTTPLIITSANTSGLQIGCLNVKSGSQTLLSDSGTGTQSCIAQSYTPTVTGNAGVVTSTALGTYKIVGKTLFIQAGVFVTATSSTPSFLNVTLPTGITISSVQAIGYADSNVSAGSAQVSTTNKIIMAPANTTIPNSVANYYAGGTAQIN